MHLSRAIVPAIVIDTHHSGTQISFSAEEREARSSGGFTLKEGGEVRVRLDNGFMALDSIYIYIYLYYIHVNTMHLVRKMTHLNV